MRKILNFQVHFFVGIGWFTSDHNMCTVGISNLYTGLMAMGFSIMSHYRMCKGYLNRCVGFHVNSSISRTLLCYCKSTAEATGTKKLSLTILKLTHAHTHTTTARKYTRITSYHKVISRITLTLNAPHVCIFYVCVYVCVTREFQFTRIWINCCHFQYTW